MVPPMHSLALNLDYLVCDNGKLLQRSSVTCFACKENISGIALHLHTSPSMRPSAQILKAEKFPEVKEKQIGVA